MKSEKTSIFRRGAAGLWRSTVTGVFIAGAAAAAVSGSSFLSSRNVNVEGPAPAPATSVRTTRIKFQNFYDVERHFTGVFEASQETVMAFELAGSVTDISLEEGDWVSKGDVIARLDTQLLLQERERLRAAKSGLEADAELARRTNARQEELKARGFATAQRVDDTSLALVRIEAALAETSAAIAAVEIQLAKSELRAAFDGRINARFVDEGTVIGAGTPVFSILEDAPLRFRVGIAPDLAERLSAGDLARVETDLGPFDVRLERMAPDLDPFTRAKLAYFTVPAAEGMTAGRTGELVLSSQVETDFQGAWVPLDALRQGPRGSWTVLTVEDDGSEPTAAVAAVEIQHVATGRAFVRGTFGPDTRLVEVGPHRIVPGDRVTVLDEQEMLSWAR